MKIAITGAHSTGKSTLFEIMKEFPELSNYKFSCEQMRNMADSGLVIGVSPEEEISKAGFFINNSVFKENNIVTDRYSLDGYVYSLYFNTGATKLYEDCSHLFYEPDIILYLKPEFDIVDDNFRNTDVEFRDSIAKIFDTVIEEYKIPVILISGDISERVYKIKQVLSSCIL